MKLSFGRMVSSATLAAAAFVGMSFTAPATAGIAGSPHDFSARGWGTTEVCIFCHAPHNTTGGTPLWNHKATAATFTLYSSTTLNATLAQPAGVSKLCLSCHDGTVAVDSYGTRTGATNVAGTRLIGTDLSNDHPIGFAYTAALATADGGLVAPASASQVVAGVPLYGSQLECASCHDVHNNTLGSFLRMANTGSALCVKCHTK